MSEVLTPVRQQKRVSGSAEPTVPPGRSSSSTSFPKQLLAFESEVRAIEDRRELNVHLCNSTRRVVGFRQSFYGITNSAGKRFKLQAVSSVAVVDRSTPFNIWIEKTVARLLDTDRATVQIRFTLPEFCDDHDEEKDTYPFREFLWTPQCRKGKVIGGVLMARETPWEANECALVNRLSGLYLHAQAALEGQQALIPRRSLLRPVVLGTCALLVALGFLPVSVTALAPAEVLPREPYVLAAPFDGVVTRIATSQGAAVAPGEPVVIFDDVHLLNEKNLADQRAAIAQARFQRASQGAIADAREKREIEVSKAEYQLAVAESRYATELLEKARMSSPVPGIAIFSDKRDWEGKPVSAGQAIVSIADPANVQFSIDLPVKESVVLDKGARVKVFLDSDPLNPLEAVLTDVSYRAQPDKRDILSYALRAELTGSDQALPRIGVQGTAQVYSDKASLAYVVFRRPLAALRQYTGW